MGQEIVYQWISDGVNTQVSSITITDVSMETSGYIDLLAGKATVNSFYAGKSVIITRNQDNTTAIGNVYIYSPNIIPKVSFEIRSTNALDTGTVFWQIVE